jgi:phosphoglycolate phosphatase
MSVQLDPEADAGTAFRGGRAMLRLGFARAAREWSEAAIDAAFPSFLRHYEARIDETSHFYPGARETVEALRAAGWRTGICTNKPERLAELLLDRMGLRGLFDGLVGADTLPVRKPDPAPYLASVARSGGRLDTSLLVGDTDTDRQTAKRAGVPCILITFGPDGRTVAALEPEGLIDGFADLGGVVRGLIG